MFFFGHAEGVLLALAGGVLRALAEGVLLALAEGVLLALAEGVLLALAEGVLLARQKNQKTFINWSRLFQQSAAIDKSVFASFFAKKEGASS